MTSELVAASSTLQRRLPVGAEPHADGGTHFRVWTPAHHRVQVELENAQGAPLGSWALTCEAGGYHAALVEHAHVGDRYRFRLGEGTRALPDPASRFQPEGPHGPSEIVDPARYAWRDAGWTGVERERAVVYEMHIGTFTPDGTWAAAQRELAGLAELGITVLEVMPVADFPGRFGWGYDGVNLFAPTRLYGTPDDMRRFVDRAHALGMAVVLDVVYNHLGPDGNHLREYSASYFSTVHATEWGESPNFDGERCAPVRELFAANAAYWIEEFHLDGLRIDATQSIFDDSERHILLEIAERARAAAAGRTLLLIAENEPQDVRMLHDPAIGGFGLDAAWNDDFHHAARVALTGRREAYYTDYGGTAQEFVSAARRSYLFQGQHYAWQCKRRGTTTAGLEPSRFVHYLQNHDQIANSGDGARLHELTSPGRLRAMTALLLLGPQIPMLFQGQEFAASSPFLFFADHHPELAARVRKGRRDFLAQFPSIASPEVTASLAPPDAPATFDRSMLDPAEREQHAGWLALHRDLLRLRRDDHAIRAATRRGVDGAVLDAASFVLRYGADMPADERLLVVNLGGALTLESLPEPLLAPPAGFDWSVLWCSEAPEYGGHGAAPRMSADAAWHLPAETALLLAITSRDGA